MDSWFLTNILALYVLAALLIGALRSLLARRRQQRPGERPRTMATRRRRADLWE